MSNRSFASLSPAVTRATRHAVFVVLVVSVVAFSFAGERVTSDLARQLAVEQARLLALAFVPELSSDLSISFERIRSQTDRLVAFGVTDGTTIQSVYPDEIAFRSAVTSCRFDQGPIEANVEVDGESQPVWILSENIMTVDGNKTPVVLLLRRHAHLAGWAIVSTSVAAGTLILALLVSRLLGKWFERRVVRPLRGLAGLDEHADAKGGAKKAKSNGGWEETERIASKFDELLTKLEQSQERSERLERAKQWEMLKKEEGFNSQLRRVKNQATTDPLTQLRNRGFLEENLKGIVDQQHEQVEDLAFVMIDIDNFKHHNDTRGHAAGDEVLRFAGQLLRGAIRPADHAIRYGGDEFTLLLLGVNDRQARAVVERIVKMFAQYASRFSSEKAMSMSAGVATLDQVGKPDVDALVSAADEALYTAKSRGKNTVAAHAVA